MKSLPITNPAPFLPHRHRMLLLTKILHYDETSLSALASLDESTIFAQEGALPSWAALELMAQAVAAWSGCLADDEGEEVRLGFLLGTRKLICHFDFLPLPSTLLIKTVASTHDTSSGFGVFDAQLFLSNDEASAGRLLAQASLNVYSPKEDVVSNASR